MIRSRHATKYVIIIRLMKLPPNVKLTVAYQIRYHVIGEL